MYRFTYPQRALNKVADKLVALLDSCHAYTECMNGRQAAAHVIAVAVHDDLLIYSIAAIYMRRIFFSRSNRHQSSFVKEIYSNRK